MKKITIKVNVLNIDKSRFEEREYDNKKGEHIKEKNLVLEGVIIDEPRTITSGDTWELQNIGFVTQAPTKEERTGKVKMPIIGGMTTFKNKEATPNFDTDSQGKSVQEDDGFSPF